MENSEKDYILTLYMLIKSRTSSSIGQETLLLEQCYAKTTEAGNSKSFGLTVYEHGVVVGEVARLLLELFPAQVRKKVFPDGVALIAACHDVGKINPHFLKKLYQAVMGRDVETIPAFRSANIELEQSMGWHAGVSQITLEKDHPQVALIIGRHHGSNHQVSQLPDDPLLGGKPWQALRCELIAQLRDYFKEEFPQVTSIFQASAIAGLVTVADWIGSGTIFQHLKTLDTASVRILAQQAVKTAGFIQPRIRKGLSFEQIFGFPPNPVQASFIDLVRQPGTYIVETMMGQGKTEAALYGAYAMLDQGYANGIYFALPTRLTSERMQDRVQRFLDRILEDNQAKSLFLLHGFSWLAETELGEEGAVSHAWFDNNKRKILAPFAVGTLDQALLSVLHVKHGFVRSFGLAGKVVILDEIHSYDAYTGTLLSYLVKELEALGCTVILLSATLTAQRKEELLDEKLPSTGLLDPYPQIASKQENRLDFRSPKGPETRICNIHVETSTKQAIQLVREASLAGLQVLWIENTVEMTQEVFKACAAWGNEADVEVGLLHSRFPMQRRSELEDHWVGLYGKDGFEKRSMKGRILFGTQVLEQSLDIDADLLVSRIAPSDMLLQRMGRLWRHERNNVVRPKGASMTMVILTPDVSQHGFNLKYGFGPSGAVYAPYVLWRTFQVWKNLATVSIPDDIRKILESTYYEQAESGWIAAGKAELQTRKNRLKAFAFNNMALVGATYDESAVTRYSEIPTCPVLLLSQIPQPGSNQLHLIDGTALDISPETRKYSAIMLMQTLIHVPYYMAPQVQTKKELKWLEPFIYVSDDENTRIRVAVVDKSGCIRTTGGIDANTEYQLSYNPVVGYVATKKKEEAWNVDTI